VIFALEGISAVGKSSVAGVLEDAGLPVFRDPVRHGLLGDLNRRELFLAGNQCGLTLAHFAPVLDFVADRWCLSSFVYDVWGDVTLDGAYLTRLLPIYARTPARVYLLRVDPDLAYRRMLDRAVGPTYSREQLHALDRGFSRAAEVWAGLGGHVREVDATDVPAAAAIVLGDVRTP